MGQLKKVSNPVLDEGQAHSVLEWVFGRLRPTKDQMTKADRGFAQAILVELLDASFKIGFVEALFKAAAKIPSGPAKVIKEFLKGAGKNLITYKDKDDLEKMMEDPQIYQMALNKLAANFKSVWKIREDTGELIY